MSFRFLLQPNDPVQGRSINKGKKISEIFVKRSFAMSKKKQMLLKNLNDYRIVAYNPFVRTENYQEFFSSHYSFNAIV
jgi:hypothetical protein